MFGRRKVATLVAEFLGTGVLTLLILSLQRTQYGLAFFVAILGGATLALMTIALSSTSGALFNPALTLGMWVARKISTVNTILFIAVQMLGAWAAYGLYKYFIGASLPAIGGHFTVKIMVIEAVSTGIFAFGYAAAYFQRLSVPANGAAVGLSYMVGLMCASTATAGLLNPALALGDRAFVLGTYVLGPIVGALIGINLYKYLYAPLEEAEEFAAANAGARVNPATATIVAPTTTAAPTKAAKTPARKTTTKATTTTKKPAAKTTAAKKTTTRKTAAKKK